MPFVQWVDELSVGIDRLDSDHRQMIASINRLQEALLADQGPEIMGDILAELQSYMDRHFRMEEGLMEGCNYPDLESHRAEHQNLAMRVASYQEAATDGNRKTMLELQDLLVNWLLEHIDKTDRAYIPYLQKMMES